jgi:hypothetical protein
MSNLAEGREEGIVERKGPMVELTFNWDLEAYTGGRNSVTSPTASTISMRSARS